MPGTDICLKIGGYVRAETTYHSNGNFGAGPDSNEVFMRQTSEWAMRARAYITADAREQSAWGTIRAYVAVGVATTDTGATIVPAILGFNRAFIQWAGMTAGITQSFFDFYSAAAVGYRAYLPSSDTGDAGWWLWAYTTQLGNGLSASISAEQRRTSQIINITNVGGLAAVQAPVTGFTNGTINTGGGNPLALPSSVNGYGGIQVPDIVGNVRIDQTWGSAQIMAAAHQVNSLYYDINGTNAVLGNNGVAAAISGHPGDEWGWVVAAGLRWNFPYFAQGDYFQTQVNYTHGALRYLEHGNGAPNYFTERGNGSAFGVTSDCVVASNGKFVAGVAQGTTGCQLTTAWGVNASYEHYWTPQFHEFFVFGYLRTEYDAVANANLCAAELGLPAGAGNTAIAPGGCDNNFTLWSEATRLQYDFTKTLYMGVEFLYQQLDTAKLPLDTIPVARIPSVAPAGNGLFAGNQLKNENNLSVTLRVHKDFLP